VASRFQGALRLRHYNPRVDGERGKRLPSFLLGGRVGSGAGLAAAGARMKTRAPRRRETPAGLAAFERAPCYRELVERETRGRGDV
jgi:hypothetical protein